LAEEERRKRIHFWGTELRQPSTFSHCFWTGKNELYIHARQGPKIMIKYFYKLNLVPRASCFLDILSQI